MPPLFVLEESIPLLELGQRQQSSLRLVLLIPAGVDQKGVLPGNHRRDRNVGFPSTARSKLCCRRGDGVNPSMGSRAYPKNTKL
eukprot:3524643-Ditylum_brightwellii.AAC.1